MIEQSIRPTQQFTIVTRARHDYQLTELRTTAAFILEEEGAGKDDKTGNLGCCL